VGRLTTRRVCTAHQVMLLANLMVSPTGAALLLQEGKGALEGASLLRADKAVA
jgi:hypothetical protein